MSHAEKSRHDAGRCDHVVFEGERASGGARVVRSRSALSTRAEWAEAWAKRRGEGEEELPAETAAFYSWLLERYGLRAEDYRPAVLRRRESALLRAVRAETLSAARAVIENDAERGARALAAVMIGVTAFFRDAAVYRQLAGTLAGLSAARGRLDVLSVGCSEGQETYSVAMLTADAGLLARTRVMGVDCREDAVAAARGAVYAPATALDMEAGPALRYFEPVSRSGEGGRVRGGLRVVEAVRGVCRFVQGDAAALPAECAGPYDLALCRNLVIYLEPEAGGRVWSGLWRRLRRGGLLVVGRAERPQGGNGEGWARVGPCMYRKVEG